MTTTTTHTQTTAQLLAAEIEGLSAEVIQEIAALLDSTPDKDLFGDTEFVIRAKVLKIVAQAYSARLAQKKRLSRRDYLLPPLPALRRLPRLPLAKTARTGWSSAVPSGLLPLRHLRSRFVSLGPRGRPDRPQPDSGGRALGHPRRRRCRQLREKQRTARKNRVPPFE